MKRTILKVAMLAIIVGALVSACGKDEDDTPRNGTPTIENPSRWPEGARLTGGDSCITWTSSNIERIAWRIDSLLCIYYHNDIVLPDGFCAVLPISVAVGFTNTGSYDYGDRAAVVIFKGNREDAINKLKQVDGIYAINPVYRNVREWLIVPSAIINAKLLLSDEEQVSDENMNQLMSIAEDLRLRLIYSDTGAYWIDLTFLTEYSMVNSVVATDIIETGCNVHYISPLYYGPNNRLK